MFTQQQLEQQIAALKAENARLLANKAATGSSIKLSEKGAVCVYGLGRFPVALYPSQWEKLGQKMPEVAAFIQANAQLIAERTANRKLDA